MSVRKGDPQYIRGLNDQLVLDRIFHHGKVSRAEISRVTGLSKPTASSAVQRLIDKNWIREVGRGENAQGRKSTLLEFNHAAYYVCGIDLGATRVRLALARPDGSLLDEDNFEIPAGSPESLQHLLLERVEQLLLRHGADWGQVPYISVGTPAVVMPETGSSSLIVTGLKRFEEAISLPALTQLFPSKVMLENDVNLATMAEQSDGIANGINLFAYLAIGAGVGAGVVVEGRLLRGMGGAAGELGHMLLSKETKVEDVLSVDGLLQLARDYLNSEQQSSLLRQEAELTPELIFRAVRQGDSLAIMIHEIYCEFLARTIHNLSVIVAPELIVLGGEIGAYADVLISGLQLLTDNGFPVKPKLAGSLLGERAVVLGAVNTAARAAYGQIRDELSDN
ncbi:ROK family transcriptional regulator [Paenibacillus sp. 19GGS1-52]|uniref:ROK family transcriptional regulator n=1 Tax=Paenibacillus sp. 19GGS1-52 TaxID=2758563 RepID=UPI001EFC00CF|nr:ROK family transcriptional regulator [Paenibacillus sp. 19GGS1-52]ULO08572.1 ROK family transcriptional regulator [Paenibacillus sp. 19GGS1-52]